MPFNRYLFVYPRSLSLCRFLCQGTSRTMHVCASSHQCQLSTMCWHFLFSVYQFLEWVLYICVYNISYICIFIQGDSLPHVNPSTTCSWVHCEQNKCMSTFLIEAPVKCYTHAQVSGQKNGTILKFTKPAIACVSATSIGRSTGMNQTFKWVEKILEEVTVRVRTVWTLMNNFDPAPSRGSTDSTKWGKWRYKGMNLQSVLE